jgi:hypothetical protein
VSKGACDILPAFCQSLLTERTDGCVMDQVRFDHGGEEAQYEAVQYGGRDLHRSSSQDAVF